MSPRDVVTFLRGFYLISHTIESTVKDVCGLTLSQYEALLHLEGHPGVHLSELTGALALKPSTVSLIAAQLERRGFVLRAEDEADGRAFLLSNTPAGADALARTGAALMGELRRQWRHLSLDEMRVVSRLDRPDLAVQPDPSYLANIDAILKSVQDALRPVGLTLTQELVLVGLGELGPDTRPVQLERYLDIRSNTLASATKHLEARGLIRAARLGTRAGTKLSVTDEGRAFQARALAAVTPALARVLAGILDPEALRRSFEINDVMVSAAGPAAGCAPASPAEAAAGDGGGPAAP